MNKGQGIWDRCKYIFWNIVLNITYNIDIKLLFFLQNWLVLGIIENISGYFGYWASGEGVMFGPGDANFKSI